jgi:predicted outer membrane repeat protein
MAGAVAAGAPFALVPAAAHAIEVTNANPNGPGSLADAVFVVNSSPTEDTITFASIVSGQTIATDGELVFSSDEVYILGPGADKLTISGGNAHRVLRFDPVSVGTPAEVRGVTLSGGNAGGGNGGAILNAGADLVVADAVLSGSAASNGGGAWIGDNLDTRFERSTISGNTAASGGGAIYADDDLDLVANSTITGNRAAFGGGVSINGPAAIQGSTIAGNVAESKGGGVYNEGLDVISLSGTIVADNSSAEGVGADLRNAFVADFSLIESLEGGTVTDGPFGHNVFSLDPQLGPLAANGGTTPTRMPSPASPALDKSQAFSATDQRGRPRPFDIPSIGNSGNGADIGAVELQPGEFPAAKKKCKKKRRKHHGKKSSAAKKKKKKKKGKHCKKKKGKKGKKK